MDHQILLYKKVDEEGKEIINIKKTPKTYVHSSNRYVHCVEYVVYTVKDGQEEYLNKRVYVSNERI